MLYIPKEKLFKIMALFLIIFFMWVVQMMMGIIIIILVTQWSAKSIVFTSTANRHPFYLCYFIRCLCLIIVYFNLIDLDINVILYYSIYMSKEKEANLVIVFLLAVTSLSSGRY